MVRFEGETSNALFEVLEDWNTHLKAENIELSSSDQPKKTHAPKGPSL